jgi:hypothetical protein
MWEIKQIEHFIVHVDCHRQETGHRSEFSSASPGHCPYGKFIPVSEKYGIIQINQETDDQRISKQKLPILTRLVE